MRKAKIIKSLRAENKSLSDRLYRAAVVREDLELQLQSAFEELEQAEMEIASLRKTRPKLDTPFKCYIYCTLEGSREFFHSIAVKDGMYEAQEKWYREDWYERKGNVIGEFVCDEIIKNDIDVDGDCLWGEAQDCLTDDEFEAYIKNVNVIYGWHISALKIYDKPKELSAFYRTCPGLNDVGMCWACDKAVGEEHDCGVNGEVHLSRPPQSWCYVEENVWRK